MRDRRAWFGSRGRGQKPGRVTLQVESLESRDVPVTFSLAKPSLGGLVGSFAVDKVRKLDYEPPRATGNAFQQSAVLRSPTTGTSKATSSAFQITLRYTDSSVTASQKAVFTQAAQRWSQIIVGDLPDGYVSGIGAVDDLVVSISAPNIDGNYGVLGQAGPTHLRNGSYLPLAGVIEFDRADMARMAADGSLYAVAVHEMGHILGFGTIWDLKGLIVGAGGSNPRFVGARATAEYQALFNTSATSVPVENSGGSGTRDAHWRESVFDNEIMTGYINAGNNPLSRVTVASLGDLGYKVDLSAADPFGSSNNSNDSNNPPTPGPGDAPGQVQYADVNGDGEADLIFQTKSNAFWVWTGSSAGFGNPVKAMQHGGSYRAGQAQYADVNGDGKADLIFQNSSNAFYLSLSTGAGFTAAQKVAQAGGTFRTGQAQFADVNGDGNSDLVFQGLDNSFWLYQSWGGGFNSAVKAAKHGGSFRAGQAQYADINGDGNADLIFQNNNNAFWLSLSAGTSFGAPVNVLKHAGLFQAGQAQYADVSGDGQADLIFQAADNSFWLSLSTASGFSAPTKIVQHSGAFVKDQAKYADVNGDGLKDLLIQDQNGIWLYFA